MSCFGSASALQPTLNSQCLVNSFLAQSHHLIYSLHVHCIPFSGPMISHASKTSTTSGMSHIGSTSIFQPTLIIITHCLCCHKLIFHATSCTQLWLSNSQCLMNSFLAQSHHSIYTLHAHCIPFSGLLIVSILLTIRHICFRTLFVPITTTPQALSNLSLLPPSPIVISL
jgi:hypothetical protein